MEARELSRIFDQVVELGLTGPVLHPDVALSADRGVLRRLDQELAPALDLRMLRRGEERTPVDRKARRRA